jgi:hypothetical protein
MAEYLMKCTFIEASPLLEFINQYKDNIIGQRICNFYRDNYLGGVSDGPMVLEFEKFSLIIHYYWYSDLTLYAVAPEKIREDMSLNFLYRDIWESRNVCYWVQAMPFPYIGSSITAVEVERFSEEFEINPSTGETRPAGGDYFSKITIHFENGGKFYFCAADSICDGYMEVWD